MKKISNYILNLLYIRQLYYDFVMWMVNKCLKGTNPKLFGLKRKLLNSLGNYSIGDGTKIVGPIYCSGKLTIGESCWIGMSFYCNGNGCVTIGNNCDIGPEVVFQTGGHEIGNSERRAGNGRCYNQIVGNGVWIGGRSTIIGNTNIGKSCVIAGCACVVKDVPDNTLVGGVPAKEIRKLC